MVVLIAVMLARFQREAMPTGDLRRLLVPLVRVLVPYHLIVGAYALAWRRMPWGSVPLVSNFGTGAPANFDRSPLLYWFFEAFAQMVLLLAALVLVPQVRQLVARGSFRFVFPLLSDIGVQRIFKLAWVPCLAALGWLVCAAAERAPTGTGAGFGRAGSGLGRGAALSAADATAEAAGATLACRGGASCPIHLIHRFVPNLLLAPLVDDLQRWVFANLSIGGRISLGLAAFALQQRAVRLLWRMYSLLLHPVSNTQRGVRGV